MAHIDKKQKRDSEGDGEEKEKKAAEFYLTSSERRALTKICPFYVDRHELGDDVWTHVFLDSDPAKRGQWGGASAQCIASLSQRSIGGHRYNRNGRLVWRISGLDALKLALDERTMQDPVDRRRGIARHLLHLGLIEDVVPLLLEYITPMPRVLVLSVTPALGWGQEKIWVVCSDEQTPREVMQAVDKSTGCWALRGRDSSRLAVDVQGDSVMLDCDRPLLCQARPISTMAALETIEVDLE